MKYYDVEKGRSAEGNKVTFTIPSVDGKSINHKYKVINKAVKKISKKISSLQRQYDKALQISEDYAKDYCYNNFEIKYAGKEDGIFYQTLETVQTYLNKKDKDNKTFAEIIKHGALPFIPGVGEVTMYKILMDENVGRGSAFGSVAVSFFNKTLGILSIIIGDANLYPFFYGTGTAIPFTLHLIKCLDNIEDIEFYDKIDINKYLVKTKTAITSTA